jgi:hypothetical protein
MRSSDRPRSPAGQRAPAQRTETVSAGSRKSTTSYAVPILIHALLVSATLSPDVQAFLAGAFGPKAFGLPIALVAAAAVAILFLPFTLAVHHFMQIAERAAAEGHSLGKIGLLAYAASVGQRHPDLRRSQLMSLAGLVYFIVLCAAWIAYADARGL